jgi:GNAT superfamily N-acetyltransferase
VGTGGPVDGVRVERLPAGEPSEALGVTLLGGHEVPADAPAAHWSAAARFPTLATHECFLARDASTGEPLGAALLVAHDGVGYLANASTLPPARGRGVQTALIRARCERARERGCETVEVVCVPWSVSNRNLRRAGLSVVHTRVQWTPAPMATSAHA